MPTSRPLRSASVRDELTRRIQQGHMRAGTRLPSEPELAIELGVSRPTLREALRSLEADGLVRRMRGSGTFVADHPRVANSLDRNFGVTDAIRQAGMRPGTRQARLWIEPASVDEAERLGVRPGRDLIVIERVRTADDRPVVLSRDLLSHDLLGGRTDLMDRMLQGSVYQVLEQDMDVVIDHGIASFQPVQADWTVARKLGVPGGELLLYLWQIDYTADGTPVLTSHEYHLAQAFDFSLVRRGPGRRIN